MNRTPPPAPSRAGFDELSSHPGKAELIGGRIVPRSPGGHRHNLVTFRIVRNLDDITRATGRGVTFTGTIAFAVPELNSGRESFSPDASYYDGPPPSNTLHFVPGPPTFAVEVLSKGDCGAAAEAEMAAKRADYFEAGTPAVWDVDLREECVRLYRDDAPDRPAVFVRGQVADAEPAVPGWRMAVADIFA